MIFKKNKTEPSEYVSRVGAYVPEEVKAPKQTKIPHPEPTQKPWAAIDDKTIKGSGRNKSQVSDMDVLWGRAVRETMREKRDSEKRERRVAMSDMMMREYDHAKLMADQEILRRDYAETASSQSNEFGNRLCEHFFGYKVLDMRNGDNVLTIDDIANYFDGNQPKSRNAPYDPDDEVF